VTEQSPAQSPENDRPDELGLKDFTQKGSGPEFVVPVLIMTVLILVIGVFLLGYQNYKLEKALRAYIKQADYAKNLEPELAANMSHIKAAKYAAPVDPNLKNFTDEEIKGFALKYDQRSWLIEKDEEIKYCSDVDCSPSVGKSITVTNKKYAETPKKLSVIINLENDGESFNDPTEICFGENDIDSISPTVYRAKNPSLSAAEEARDHLWQRYYYRAGTLHVNNGKQCITGGINRPLELQSSISYHNKPVGIVIWSDNTVSSDSAKLADEVVNGIQINGSSL
jgi:hypothetical protein